MLKLQALSSMLARLSKREKAILYGAAAFILLASIDFFIVNPIADKLDTLNREIEEKRGGIKRMARILSHKDTIITESSKYSVFLDNYKTEEEEVASILKEVERIANKNSFYIADMVPRKGAKTMGDSVEYSITLSGEGEIEQIINFIYEIENSRKLLTIRNYEIAPKGKNSSVAQCSMTISKLSIP